MTDIPLPPALTNDQVRGLARAFIRGEAFVPKSENDPALGTLLRVTIRYVHDQMVAGHTAEEWTRFQEKVIFISNPSFDSASMIPPADVRIVLRSDEERVAKLIRPLMDFPGLQEPGAAGYG